MLAAKRAAGEPLPERKYTHATKPKPTFLKKFSAPKLPQNAAMQQTAILTAAPPAVRVTSPGKQPSHSRNQGSTAAPVGPASPDSAAAKPASIAAQGSISSPDSTGNHENGFQAVSKHDGQVEVPFSQSKGGRKALFTEEDGQEPLVETGTLCTF